MTRRIALIFGAGPGLATSLATHLARTHSLFLLSRSLPSSLPSLHLPSSISVEKDKLLAATSDGSVDSLDKAFKKLKETWPDGRVDVGVVNSNAPFSPGGFLDKKGEDLRASFESIVVGPFNLLQHLLPLFLSNAPSPETGAKATLIFTGATASLRGGARFSTLSPAMFARRSLAQSLAREFGPQGVHVAHVVVDGMIDTPAARERMGEDTDGKRLNPDDIALTYLNLINQPKSAWTHELEVRYA